MSKHAIALVILAGFSSWPTLPQSTAGWQSLTDRRQLCQGKSPQGWEKLSTIPKGNVPGIARVVAQIHGDGTSFTFDFVKTWGGKAIRVFEDSPARYWVEFDGKTGMITDADRAYRFHWFVAVPSNPVCSMHIFFDDPALTEQAKLIAKSVQRAK